MDGSRRDPASSPQPAMEADQMEQEFPEGNAIVYCEGAFGTTNGKTAHGLVRRSRRYQVLAVVDSRHSGRDSGEVLDGRRNGIQIEREVLLFIDRQHGRQGAAHDLFDFRDLHDLFLL